MKTLLLLLITFSAFSFQIPQNRPNVIIVLADDLGIGDVSCYNKKSKIITSNIDKLAKKGMKFTNAHSSSSVCTPSRYGILTGRYAWRSKLKFGVLWGHDSALIEPSRFTLASLFKVANYKTGCVGKWHLGLNWAKDSLANIDFTKPISNGPNTLGFDYFYGIPASLDIPPYVFIENDKVTSIPTKYTQNDGRLSFWRYGLTSDDFVHENVLDKILSKSKAFIEANRDKPFFLYLLLTSPHTPILPKIKGKSTIGEYGDFVMQTDNLLGDLIKHLDSLKLSENTIIFFTSDNGYSPYADLSHLDSLGHQPSMNYRGYKADIFEGGNRIPLIVSIPEGLGGFKGVSDRPICLTDLMATFSELLNSHLAEYEGVDSFSFLSEICKNVRINSKRAFLINHSDAGVFSITKDNWKLILSPSSGGWSFPRSNKMISCSVNYQFYNLKTDVSEKKNLVSKYPVKVSELTQLLIESVKAGRSTAGRPQPYVNPKTWNFTEWMN